MPIESRDDGSLLFGYLDTDAPDRARAFDTVLVHSADRPFEADLRPLGLGALSTCDIHGEHEVRVRSRLSPQVQSAGLMVGLLLSGDATLEQDGRRTSPAPGELLLYTAARPFLLEISGPYRWFVLRMDCGTAHPAGAAENAVANRDLRQSPGGRILTATLVEVADLAHRLGPLSRHDLGESVAHMLRTLMREAARPQTVGNRVPVLDRVLGYIDHHLAEELPPATIAAAHHISVRHLHALFRQQGDTVGDHVRRRRLDHIRRDLADPGLAHLPAYAVAARWGFREASHFGKAFRAEYGTSPGDFRARALPTP
ncbi:helix-turn-helix domain-containing protein [Embleya sp. AB8]|uniref:helix-turn-helix domain-containing protein n=1 Tax=Embleya sp. AB8 TaxID=3156304 RepID=UPI003C75ACB7